MQTVSQKSRNSVGGVFFVLTPEQKQEVTASCQIWGRKKSKVNNLSN